MKTLQKLLSQILPLFLIKMIQCLVLSSHVITLLYKDTYHEFCICLSFDCIILIADNGLLLLVQGFSFLGSFSFPLIQFLKKRYQFRMCAYPFMLIIIQCHDYKSNYLEKPSTLLDSTRPSVPGIFYQMSKINALTHQCDQLTYSSS